MLEYDRIDISEGIDTDKTSASKECNICHYWYFLDKNFNYDLYLCNGCHDLMQKAMSFKNVAIVSIKGNDYRIHFSYISKNDAIALMTNSNLNDKNRVLYRRSLTRLTPTYFFLHNSLKRKTTFMLIEP